MDIYLSIYGCVTYYHQSINRSILFIFVAEHERIFEHRQVKTATAAAEADALTEAVSLTEAEWQWLLEEAPPVEDLGRHQSRSRSRSRNDARWGAFGARMKIAGEDWRGGPGMWPTDHVRPAAANRLPHWCRHGWFADTNQRQILRDWGELTLAHMHTDTWMLSCMHTSIYT